MPELPQRVTMPLLTLITQQALDEDYLHVAERRAMAAPGPPRGRPRRTAAVMVAVFGVLVATAAIQTSRNHGVDQASRTTLVTRINDERGSVSKLQDKIARLRDRISALQAQSDQLSTTEQAAVSRLRRLQVRTGFVAVHGEGIRITIDDAPDGDPDGKVRDEDLAKVANGLWEAGAEAVSINGQRLTAVSAIRNSSLAIQVNTFPLTPPYTVLAIGDTRTLQANFLDSDGGQLFSDVVSQVNLGFDMENVDALSLPAAPAKLLRLTSVQAGASDDLPAHDKETTP
ncbi:DUF881 domain-containing protein [Nocardioides sp.]|jgi:uncharacterized protein YlxW (UPF0749 family)|uniref:DUF881 domain-containing protein n=1 Tax=Nocardioides sp. TaxID=35761 RepID=UPI0031FF1F43|nr:hypothetical protein [Nocardioides sp.]